MVKQLEIIRLEKSDDGVLGVLLIQGIMFCYTLEHPTLLISSGSYPAIFEYSPKFDRNLYELKTSCGRTEIKIHVGNTMDDTEGCPLLGSSVGHLDGKRAVLNSAETVDRFHHRLKGNTVNISIMDLTGL